MVLADSISIPHSPIEAAGQPYVLAPVSIFQFHTVRLRHLTLAVKKELSDLFQFHTVRLRRQHGGNVVNSIPVFQFHTVRLRRWC